MTSDIQTSPLPWRAVESGGALSPMEVYVTDANNVVVLRMATSRNKRGNQQALETARAIVIAMNNDNDDSDARWVACCMCHKPTTYDPVYQDLCGSCVRCSSE